jgi:hypothetical protein
MANGADSTTHVKLRRIPAATILCSGPTPKARSRSREGPLAARLSHRVAVARCVLMPDSGHYADGAVEPCEDGYGAVVQIRP